MAIKQKVDIDVVVSNQRRIDALEKALGRTSRASLNLGNAARIAASAIAAVGAVKLVRSFVDVGREVEQLQLRFKFLFGSAEEGAKAFDVLNQFAATVPFSLGEIAAASGNLAVVSDDAQALNKNLQLTANIAAVAGLSFQQTGEQLQRALSGGIAAADIFRERGVTALLGFEQGAKVTVEETQKRLLELFGPGGQFATAAADMANTLTGTLSMIDDSFRKFQEAVAAGFFEELKTQFGDLDKFMKENEKQIKIIGGALGNFLAKSARAAGNSVAFLKDNFTLISSVFAGIIALKMASVFMNIARSLSAVLIVSRSAAALTGVGLALVATSVAAGVFAKKEMDELFNDLAVAVDESAEASKKMVNEAGNVNREMGIMKHAASSAANSQKELKEAADENVVSFDNLKKANRSYIDSILQMGESEFDKIMRIEEEHFAKLDKLYEDDHINYMELEKLKTIVSEDAAKKRTKIYERETQARQKQLDSAITKIKTGKIAELDLENITQEEKVRIAKDAGRSILEDAATFNKKAFDSFKAVRIVEAIIEGKKAVQSAFAFGTSIGGPPLGFLFGAAAAAFTASQVNAIRSQQFPGRERGGPVSRNRSFLVGEGGPEIFRPTQGGTIIPNDQIGSSNVTVNFNVTAVDARSFDNLLQQRRDTIVGVINQAMNERGKRGLTA